MHLAHFYLLKKLPQKLECYGCTVFRAFPSHMVLGKYLYKNQLSHVSNENIYILGGSYFLSALQPLPALFLKIFSFLPSNLHDCLENCQGGKICVSLSTHQPTHILVLGFSFLPLLPLGGSSFLCSILVVFMSVLD